ncbi:MAG: hypothetical protein SFT81_02875 [Candidatus Caenarcaniphilales bacterium]|nr:hypothetical protein [Candidatus Caenarcaniphilales bacterium]
MLFKDKPIPPELVPLEGKIYEQFTSLFLSEKVLESLRMRTTNISRDWLYLNPTQKLAWLDGIYDLIFVDFFPKPACKQTFARVRFSASFHHDDWTIRFSQNYLEREHFHKIFKTWLHESFHAFLNFLTLRHDPSTQSVIRAPKMVLDLARRYPLDTRNEIAVLEITERNQIGLMDRHLTYQEKFWVGLDSYYLNVEINVENLTELTFKKIFPGQPYQRSYRTAQEYIERRMSGYAPVYAY